MEAWRCLLEAACAETVPVNVYFALGNLHSMYGDLLDHGKTAELGAEGAARAVIAEIKLLRKRAMRDRREGAGRSKGRCPRPAQEEPDQLKPAPAATDNKDNGPRMDNPEAWNWYLKAADLG